MYAFQPETAAEISLRFPLYIPNGFAIYSSTLYILFLWFFHSSYEKIGGGGNRTPVLRTAVFYGINGNLISL